MIVPPLAGARRQGEGERSRYREHDGAWAALIGPTDYYPGIMGRRPGTRVFDLRNPGAPGSQSVARPDQAVDVPHFTP